MRPRRTAGRPAGRLAGGLRAREETTMDAWMWMVLGLLCLGLEVANTGSFIFVFFGVAGMAVAALTAAALTPEFWQQSVAFLALASASLTVFRRRLLGLQLFT